MRPWPRLCPVCRAVPCRAVPDCGPHDMERRRTLLNLLQQYVSRVIIESR